MNTPKITASYITLAGAGFSEPPRFTFRQRCEAASAAGFARIGIHLNDLTTLTAADVADILSENDIELGEIEFFASWSPRFRIGHPGHTGEGAGGRNHRRG